MLSYTEEEISAVEALAIDFRVTKILASLDIILAR